MEKKTIRPRKGPEAKIQDDIIKFLTLRGWWVKIIHGSTFQNGLPDLFAAKRSCGSRWIEVKNPEGYRFTGAQMETFPIMSAMGVGIWILTAATEREYNKLFLPPNWWTYLYTPDMNK
ncbi:MAG: hypothetical protein WC942_03725 [Clostridia bacterium]|jgi:hypothetical protein